MNKVPTRSLTSIHASIRAARLRFVVYGLSLLLTGGARAAIFNFHTGAQTYTVPTTGIYEIIGYGAQGGAAFDYGTLGGLGAEIGGEFTLSAGTILDIYVGEAGQGGHTSGGGGGGTFVITLSRSLLIAAGGGGGAAPLEYGGAGLTTHTGSGGGFGGSNPAGAGGGGGGYSGGDGGGGCCYLPGDGYGGQGFPTLTGGAGDSAAYGDGRGGYGGGGGGGYAGGGGGGGYSGGFGGSNYSGSGGGSFDRGSHQVLIGGTRAGNGLVTINLVPPVVAPEPSALMLLGSGVAAIVYVRRRLTRHPNVRVR